MSTHPAGSGSTRRGPAPPHPSDRSFLTRATGFSAAHHYRVPQWDAARNQEVFGDQVRVHGHDYRLEVTVSGIPDPVTGFVVDLPALDALLDREVVSALHNGHLNEVIPEIRSGGMQPSTEALCRWVWSRIAPVIPGNARLECVRIRESRDLWAEVRREGGAE
ncbi:MAG: 6-carboxytetrahydropterin synthase [Gemmatimonadales bacterium]|nr:MAG: 6-carboxytetrahydropterin synthase [Gemmatimonadales bacterium]